MRHSIGDSAMQPECKVESCTKPAAKGRKGFCGPHYKRNYRHGDPLKGNTTQGEPISYFFSTVIPYDGDDCLIWPYARSSAGYAQVWHEGSVKYVYRLACEMVNGKPPTERHEAAHLCGGGDKGCCNPKHVEWATRLENESHKLIHGTRHYGERCHSSKLKESQVIEIYKLKGVDSCSNIAERFGVSRTAVHHIHMKNTWSSVTESLDA